MEVLYAKLYNKYSKLKNEKESQMDNLNRDQEKKFLNYVNVADEMIEYLKSENEKLHAQVDELKSELASSRSSNDEQQIQYQKLLEEVNRKNKDQELQKNDTSVPTMHEKTRNGQGYSHEHTPPEVPSESMTRLSKKRKSSHDREGAATAFVHTEHDRPADQSGHEDKPACCQRKIYSSGGVVLMLGGDSTDTSSVNCVFQHLVELVIGMKFVPLNQSNELCLLAHHQSSGYSFSLTWITNSQGETELLYRVVSLGTFERVAPEWMKETLMFSTNMCTTFFARVSHVIKMLRPIVFFWEKYYQRYGVYVERISLFFSNLGRTQIHMGQGSGSNIALEHLIQGSGVSLPERHRKHACGSNSGSGFPVGSGTRDLSMNGDTNVDSSELSI